MADKPIKGYKNFMLFLWLTNAGKQLDLRATERSGSRWTGGRHYPWGLALEEKDYFDGEIEEDDFGVAVGGDVGAR